MKIRLPKPLWTDLTVAVVVMHSSSECFEASHSTGSRNSALLNTTTAGDNACSYVIAELTLFHSLDRGAPEFSILVLNVAAALVRVAQLGGAPAVFTVVAGSIKSGSLQADIFAGGDVRSGRQNVTYFAVKNAIGVGYALGAAVSLAQGSGRFVAIHALADGVERGAFHLYLFAAFRIGTRRLGGRRAGTACQAHQNRYGERA
jgi:hypothetical protein